MQKLVENRITIYCNSRFNLFDTTSGKPILKRDRIHPKMTRNVNTRTNGFTLVEIQIAILLLVLILGLVFAAFHLGLRSWKAGHSYNREIEEKRLVSDFLRRQFSQTIPILWIDGQGMNLVFRGKKDAILFVGRLPGNKLNSIPALLQLVTRQKDGDRFLEFGYASLTPDKTPFDTTGNRMQTVTLIENIAEIHFQYFGRQSQGLKPPTWHDSWNSRKLLPRMIKCKITLKDGSHWPEMILPLHVDDPSSFRQFFLQKSVTYQYDNEGDNKLKKQSGPTIDPDDIENINKSLPHELF